MTTWCSRRWRIHPRRFLLDLLHKRDGQTLSELEWELEMTRFGVMKHLKVLEAAGLVITRRDGREKLHFLNAVPIRLIHDRWIDKYKEREVSALVDLKTTLERKKWIPAKKDGMTHVHQIYIRATAQAIWDAITDPTWNGRYGYRATSEYDLRPGGKFRALANDKMRRLTACPRPSSTAKSSK